MPATRTRPIATRRSKQSPVSKNSAPAKKKKKTAEPSASEADSNSSSATESESDAPDSAGTYLADPERFLESYAVTVNEIGVLTVEPYKSAMLPLWRFRTPDVARESAASLEERFAAYATQRDFVGMDMARKFIQMGMTRAKRYANYKGGRKYVGGEQLDKSEGHEGKQDKEEASMVFRAAWERCKADETYQELKDEFLRERKKFKAAK